MIVIRNLDLLVLFHVLYGEVWLQGASVFEIDGPFRSSQSRPYSYCTVRLVPRMSQTQFITTHFNSNGFSSQSFSRFCSTISHLIWPVFQLNSADEFHKGLVHLRSPSLFVLSFFFFSILLLSYSSYQFKKKKKNLNVNILFYKLHPFF